MKLGAFVPTLGRSAARSAGLNKVNERARTGAITERKRLISLCNVPPGEFHPWCKEKFSAMVCYAIDLSPMRARDKFTVRRAKITDLDVVAPLFDAYRQFYRKAPDPILARRFLLERLRNNDSVILLATDLSGSVMGFTQLYPSFTSLSAARIFILNDLFVAPEARRSGIGRGLLAAAKDFAQKEGAVGLTLSTEVTNVTAQALYESEGWARQKDFYTYQIGLRP